METFKKLLNLLSPNEQKQAFILFLLILIMAIIDVIGIASILPFVTVLTNPNIVETNSILNKLFEASKVFGVKNSQEFLFSLGVIVFIFLVFSLFFKALTNYVQLRFVQMRQYSIAKRIIQGYLHQPYSWFLNRNSADLGKTILSEVSQVVGGGINPLITLITSFIISITIIILLILTDPKLALIIGFSLGGTYGLIYKFSNNYLNKIGEERLKSNQLRFTTVSEAFGATKEIKLGRLEQVYLKRFADPAKIFAQRQAAASIIRHLPRYALEAIAFGGILLIILYMMSQTGNFNNSLPVISLYVFAGYRLMPALQKIYSSLSSISFVIPSLNSISDDINHIKITNIDKDNKKIFFKKNITLENINYNYPNSTKPALKNINISIPIKKTIGLVGSTGSGKTTTVDIILGLLNPQAGVLKVDDQIIDKKNSRFWQQSIGYVPQHIYLSDDTISANIAFGVNAKNIDKKNVERASKIANLHEFVINELPDKYHTTIGERGVRLSGGQRQRIGIARALYHNPKVLVLDEATSALDNITETKVMDSLYNLSNDITIILIAHRLSTVKRCNKIFILEKGQIKNEGTFEELIKINENFRITAKN